mmetsp:Transcript_23288/g.34862  ORF Transcript_23288/g.34862 Transcript_23288/m.34862 type:complete len:869 (+) Transcript_23288:44-2650(+)
MASQQVYKALWAFKASDDDQLTFEKGDNIRLLGKDPSGWWLGEIEKGDGKFEEGLFPSNYTQHIASPASRLMYDPAFGGQVLHPSGELLIMDSSVGTPKSERKRKKKKGREKPTARTVFRVWAHVQVLYGASTSLALFGLLAMHYGAEEKAEGDGLVDVSLGVLAVVAGAIFGIYESVTDGEPISETIPLRPILWLIVSFVCWISFPLWTPGIFLLIAAGIDLIGVLRSEEYVPPKKRRKTRKDKEIAEENAEMDFWDKVQSWLIHKHEENKLHRLIFCAIYAIVNVILFIYTAVVWTAAVDAMDEDERLSYYAPFAKAFGAIIDLNASLLLIPVCRTLIRILYNCATKDEGCCAGMLRTFFKFIPLDKNIMLHKTLAKISLFGVIGHTIMHFINYAIRPDPTVDRFGFWPFYSGVLLLIICQMIYSGAFEQVKRPTFEIFWYSHHLFIFYFVITLLHGEGGWNPNFWKYFLVPGLMYILERIMRYCRGRRHVILKSAMTMEPNLLSIAMDKTSAFGEAGFNEGQYVFVNCPSVKPYEWHPFTISSPPQREDFTLHIQTQGPGSWTDSVKNYLMSMGPKGRTFFEFKRRDNKGQMTTGKVLGPNGLQLLLIDGPHSAPTQHMKEYEVALIAGAGIGLTPVIACAESIVYHRWKFGVGKVFPSHAYFYWVVSHRDIEAYRWFVVKVVECMTAVFNMKQKSNIMKDKTFQFNIYITSVPRRVDKKYVDEAMADEKDDVDFWGPTRASQIDLPTNLSRTNFSKAFEGATDSKSPKTDRKIEQKKLPFTTRDLYTYMLAPSEAKRDFEDIIVRTGRPKWDPHFQQLADDHKSKNVGVMFCGNRFIGKDLKKMCTKYSSAQRNQFFRLHKENF